VSTNLQQASFKENFLSFKRSFRASSILEIIQTKAPESVSFETKIGFG